MNNVTLLECGNVDSCEPGTTHLYPSVGEFVTVWVACDLREVGTDSHLIEFEPGYMAEVREISAETHEVIVRLHGWEVWLDIDDINDLPQINPGVRHSCPPSCCPREEN